MRYIFTLFFAFLLSFSGQSQSYIQDSITIRKLYNEALGNGRSYSLLDYLCNKIGPRLSGSTNAQIAVNWAQSQMNKYGFDRVYTQQVMVPHWTRGTKEVASFEEKGVVNFLQICALGGSIGTGYEGIRSKVIEVQNFEELRKLGVDTVRGKIIFFNRPMDPTKINTFEAYSGAVNQRSNGAIEAAKLGALGVIVRSMTLSIDRYPHTGAMRYDPNINKIPAAAISTKDADFLSKRLKANPNLNFHFRMMCDTLPDAKSYNVIGEVLGYEKPEEIIVVGGHLDSWDLGTGAHDDGAGCVQAMEALRLFKVLGIRPKRTIRVVLFMNEENGLRGGVEYAKQAKELEQTHIAAVESDAGGFTPRGFGIVGSPEKEAIIKSWIPLLAPYGLQDIAAGHGGADIGPLKEQGAVLLGLSPDSQRYFDYHHAATDKFDSVNKRELELGAAALASMLYLLSQYGL